MQKFLQNAYAESWRDDPDLNWLFTKLSPLAPLMGLWRSLGAALRLVLPGIGVLALLLVDVQWRDPSWQIFTAARLCMIGGHLCAKRP